MTPNFSLLHHNLTRRPTASTLLSDPLRFTTIYPKNVRFLWRTLYIRFLQCFTAFFLLAIFSNSDKSSHSPSQISCFHFLITSFRHDFLGRPLLPIEFQYVTVPINLLVLVPLTWPYYMNTSFLSI